MGDGRVALILDVPGIGQRSGVLAEFREQTRAVADQKALSAEVQRLLLFRGGSFERLALPLALVSRLEEFPLSLIERSGGIRVVQYRDRILPLVTLGEVLDEGAPAPEVLADPAQVIVFTDGDCSVGLMVDQIIDIAEEAVTIRRRTERRGLLGSAVVGKQVTDFLDLTYVIQAAVGSSFDGARGASGGRSVLVAESSAFSRGLIRGGLDMAGYRVVEAASVEEALKRLEQQPVDLVVAALTLPSDGCAALRTAMRKKPEWESIPMLALADSADEMQSVVSANLFEDCQAKHDRKAMLESLARLAEALEPADRTPAGERK
jgi:two-component system chemotaxis sensor kinase CheA